MHKAIWLAGVVSLTHAFFADPAIAQGVAQAELAVPTFSIFSAGTTISVPDRGYGGLGGMGSASDTRAEFGPNFERGFASRRSASDAGVRVWVHDFQELEQGLATGRGAGKSVRPPEGFAARMFDYSSAPADPVYAKPAEQSDTRVAKANANNDTSFKLAHAADLLKRGQDAEEHGKLKVAALYYKSVVSLGVTPNATVAKQRLAVLESKLASR